MQWKMFAYLLVLISIIFLLVYLLQQDKWQIQTLLCIRSHTIWNKVKWPYLCLQYIGGTKWEPMGLCIYWKYHLIPNHTPISKLWLTWTFKPIFSAFCGYEFKTAKNSFIYNAQEQKYLKCILWQSRMQKVNLIYIYLTRYQIYLVWGEMMQLWPASLIIMYPHAGE